MAATATKNPAWAYGAEPGREMRRGAALFRSIIFMIYQLADFPHLGLV
jgi:hypothetical protein